MAFETIIGLEIHAELKTKTKIFCSCSTEFGKEANHNTCPICLGIPGTLPVLNKEVVALAIKAGTALNCKINKLNKMDRKNYFYPDLPKAYQTSQFDLPICSGGGINIDVNGTSKFVRLNRIHIEEDAGKLVHDEEKGVSLIDYNRVGVPLAEIVTEPDMRSPEEAVTFLKTLRSILQYADVSDCKMEQGSLRVDVNLSVREKGKNEFGTRTEMKNLNSFKAVKRAIITESKRQIEVIKSGKEVLLETRKWDDIKCESSAMRKKESAKDYRYFPDADLPKIFITDDFINEVKSKMNKLPDEIKSEIISKYGFTKKEVDILTESKTLIELFENTNLICNNPKEVLNIILGEVLRLVGEAQIYADDLKISSDKLAEIINMSQNGEINRTTAKKLIEELFYNDIEPKKYVYENDLYMITDEKEIENRFKKVFEKNKNLISDYKSGNIKIKKFFVGEAMKEFKGRAEPKLINKIIDDLFSKI